MFLFDIVPAQSRRAKGYQWRLVYLCEHADRTLAPLYQYLSGLTDEDELAKLMQLFEACCEHGPEGLPAKTRHHLDQNNQIFEFIKGRHRIAWFYDEGKMVVCTHGFFKRSQKAPKKEQKRAKQVKDAYFEAKRRGELNEL